MQLTLKEQAAIAALQAIISNKVPVEAKYKHLDWDEAIVKEAFDIATRFVIESSERG